MTLPVVPVVKPSDLQRVKNGHLGSNTLVDVQSGRLHHLAARAFGALWVHCLHFTGAHLTATYGGWYRSYDQQEDLFRRRYEVGGEHGGCKTWNGERWCKKLVDGKVPATAAVPGTSNHGWGLAIDLAYDNDPSDGVDSDDAAYIKGHSAAWEFLLANAQDFGFSWELQSEPWHIRYVAGDQLPTKVLEWEAFAASLAVEDAPPSPPPPAPVENKYGLWPLNPNKPKLANVPARNGQDKDAVRYLQLVLRDECSQNVTVDGWFGSQTEFAVRQVQKFFGLTVDGWVGPQTWGVIDMLASR